jgi:glucose/mannose-6-phosphate isomerase
MNILDNPAQLRKLDPTGVLASAKLFPDQLARSWREAGEIRLPPTYSRALNLVVAGMGGSALGARIIDGTSYENLTLPLEIVADYHLPAYVNRHSLVIVSSYSGNTEESLSCFREARARRAMVITISTGGKLGHLAVKHQTPLYLIKPAFNPSGHPRMGLGYSLGGELAIISKLGFIHLEESQVNEAVNHLRHRLGEFSENIPTPQNYLKSLVKSMQKQAIGLVSAGHLSGAAHAFQNMLNENSKTFALSFVIPELNHHFLEGLKYPAALRRNLLFLLIESETYDKVIKNRFKITGEVLKKQGFKTLSWEVKGRSPVIQALDLVQAGGLISAYLALERQLNPGPIPWVDYFKTRMES